MFEPAAEDDRPGRQPPPADDRLWRHPSEVARAAGHSAGAPSDPSADPRLSGRRFSLSTVVVAGSLGALAMLATLAAFGMVASVASPSDDDGAIAPVTGYRPVEAASTAVAAADDGVVAVRLGGGSAGVIGAGLVLESRHAVVTTLTIDPGASIAVETSPGTWASATLVDTDAATGTSLLRVRGAAGSAARTGAAPKVGATVTMTAVGPATSTHDDHVTEVIRTNGPLHHDGSTRVGLTTLTSPRPCGPAEVGVDATGAVVALVADGDDEADDRIAYAVPAEVAVRVGHQLDRSGTVDHGHIDATITADGAALAVMEVDPASRAAAAGLRGGDEVTTIETTPVDSTSELDGALVGRSADEWVQVVVRRDHRMLTLTVQLASSPEVTLVSTTLASTTTFP